MKRKIVFTLEELQNQLQAQARNAGSQRVLAQMLKVSPQYLGEVMSGSREPGPKILDALNLCRVVTYEEK